LAPSAGVADLAGCSGGDAERPRPDDGNRRRANRRRRRPTPGSPETARNDDRTTGRPRETYSPGIGPVDPIAGRGDGQSPVDPEPIDYARTAADAVR
jgi:hypothetical protein